MLPQNYPDLQNMVWRRVKWQDLYTLFYKGTLLTHICLVKEPDNIGEEKGKSHNNLWKVERDMLEGPQVQLDSNHRVTRRKRGGKQRVSQ